MDHDFGGWATVGNVKCTDGLTIDPGAFMDNDGKRVPLVWNHCHNNVNNILGHADLEYRPGHGMYAKCKFNDTESGKTARQLLDNGDIFSLSIWANQLKKINDSRVAHGDIKEVSLVIAGANPKSYIDQILAHGDYDYADDEDIIFAAQPIELDVTHVDEKKEDKNVAESEKKESGETIGEIFDTLSEKQKNAVYAIIGQALEEAGASGGNDGGDDDMKQNAFDMRSMEDDDVLIHADFSPIFEDAKRYGSLKDSFLAHADSYGIKDIETLFPEPTQLDNPPTFISRDMGWVSGVMAAVHKTPFSRIKSMFADITADEARAKGYIKGNRKKEEVFTLLKRTTTPTTVYKKQKLDRDDVTDIVDFGVVAWIKSEMRMMLDEELATAFLVGDGRLASSDDKINEQNIRPIWKDDDLYTIKTLVTHASGATDSQKAKDIIRAIIKSRKNYKGSGEPTFYTTEDVVTEMLLIEDNNGRIIYDSMQKLASTLRVKNIVTIPTFEGKTRDGRSTVSSENGKTFALIGLIVNLKDYNVGADKGGEVSMFEDFDIDYNAQKYLIETRCSGALTKPYSAIAVEVETTSTSSGTGTGTGDSDAEG